MGEDRDDRGWDGWVTSQTWRTGVWASSRSWWWTRKPGVLQSMGSQRVKYAWATNTYIVSSVQLLSHVQLFVTSWTATFQASLSITNSWNLFKLMSIKSVMSSNHLILCRPLFLLPSIFPSIRVFANESLLCIRWPKYWSLSFSIRPSEESSRLISFRIDWFDLLAVQGTLKSLHQTHSSKTSILWCLAFFLVQLSHPYMTIGKTIHSVQSLSRLWLSATPWTAAHLASLSITNSQSLLKLKSIESVIQPSHPLSSPSPAFNLSQHQGLL